MDKFILINLNQTINRAQMLEIRRERWRWFGFAFLFLIFVGLGYGVYKINDDMDQLINLREERVADVDKQIKSLKESAEIDLSKKDVQSLYTLEKKRILWSKKLKAIADVTPEDMAITKIHYYQTGGSGRMVISGISHFYSDDKEFKVVEKFMNLLKSHNEFSNDFKYMRFLSSERTSSRGQEILKFQIEARPDKPSISKYVGSKQKVGG